jgi:hypothetical protein
MDHAGLSDSRRRRAVLCSAVVVFSTIAKRVDREIYIGNWHIAGGFIFISIIAVTGILPFYQKGLGQVAVQGFYIHNAVGMWFTFLGLGIHGNDSDPQCTSIRTCASTAALACRPVLSKPFLPRLTSRQSGSTMRALTPTTLSDGNGCDRRGGALGAGHYLTTGGHRALVHVISGFPDATWRGERIARGALFVFEAAVVVLVFAFWTGVTDLLDILLRATVVHRPPQAFLGIAAGWLVAGLAWITMVANAAIAAHRALSFLEPPASPRTVSLLHGIP